MRILNFQEGSETNNNPEWSLFTQFDKGKDNYSYTSLYYLVGRVTEDTKKNKKVFSYKFKNDRLLFPLYGIHF